MRAGTLREKGILQVLLMAVEPHEERDGNHQPQYEGEKRRRRGANG
jgi:hypothetical protein